METIGKKIKRRTKTVLCLLTVLVAQLSLTGCPDDDKEDAMLEVSPENLLLNDNGKGTLTITSNTKWSVSSTSSWLSFSTMSGVGNGNVTVRATSSSTSDRTAIVTVKTESVSRQAIVSQTGISETPIEPSNPSGQQIQTFNVAGVSFNMVRVDGGTFWMGATAEQLDEAYDDEKPAHSVTLDSYYIGETEVTQQLWQVVTGLKPTSDGWQWSSEYGLGTNRPTYYVSWNDCQEFIKKLNALTGRTFRLPTEAEWEFAARGGTKSKGYKYAGSSTISDVAWYTENSYYKGSGSPDYGTHDVATKQSNELGIYDMNGNVWEWCSDWYSSSYYSNSSSNNPTGPTTGTNRVGRGGCWAYDAKDCRVSLRDYWGTDGRAADVGLRLALQ